MSLCEVRDPDILLRPDYIHCSCSSSRPGLRIGVQELDRSQQLQDQGVKIPQHSWKLNTSVDPRRLKETTSKWSALLQTGACPPRRWRPSRFRPGGVSSSSDRRLLVLPLDHLVVLAVLQVGRQLRVARLLRSALRCVPLQEERGVRGHSVARIDTWWIDTWTWSILGNRRFV